MHFGRSVLLFLSLILVVSSAMAITKNSISSYFYTMKEESTTATIVHSGKTNRACVGAQDTVSPCSSCSGLNPTGQNNLSCSDKEFYKTLTFQITLSSSQGTSYIGPTPYCPTLLVGVAEGGNTVITPSGGQTAYSTNGSVGTAGQQVTATYTWEQICGNSGTKNADCEASFKSRWYFGFVKTCGQTVYAPSDFNDGVYYVEFRHRYAYQSPAMTMNANNPCFGGTGNPYENVCHFVAYPGDQKVYIQELQANNSFSFAVGDISSDGLAMATADASGNKYSAIRVYLAEGRGTWANITLDSGRDLPVDGTSLADGRITGLTNDVAYSFIVANVDQSGIVTHFSTPGSTAGNGNQVVLIDNIDGTGQSAIPKPVYGLLDGKNCFVATAAFGSEMAPQVEMLRQFRGKYLLQNSFGKSFVEFYYKHSPAFADWIAKSEFRRAAARVILAPVIWLADLTMWSGLGAWNGFFVFVLGIMGLGVALVGTLAMVTVWGRQWLQRAR